MTTQTVSTRSFRSSAQRGASSSTLSQHFAVSNESDYEKALVIINTYFAKMRGDESKLTDEEHDHFEAVALAIQSYEQEQYPLPILRESLMQRFPVNTWDSERLRRFRAEFTLTNDDVAAIIGLTSAEIARVEQGNETLPRTASIALDRFDEYIRDEIYGENP